MAVTVNKGTINYRALLSTGYVYYGLKCSYSSSTGTSTYTINKYGGTLVTLIAAIVAAFINRVLISLGISVAGGVLTGILSTTVACDKTSYIWTLKDTTNSSHTGTMYGYKYYITDTESHTGETYYEGYTPNDWKTSGLASAFHDHMFSYYAWDVVSWS